MHFHFFFQLLLFNDQDKNNLTPNDDDVSPFLSSLVGHIWWTMEGLLWWTNGFLWLIEFHVMIVSKFLSRFLLKSENSHKQKYKFSVMLWPTLSFSSKFLFSPISQNQPIYSQTRRDQALFEPLNQLTRKLHVVRLWK